MTGDNILSECRFKNELAHTEKSYYKFYNRDLEIKRACYHCRMNMDQKNCILFQIYGHISLNKELDELINNINDKKKEIMHLQNYIDELKTQKENRKKEISDLNKKIKTCTDNITKIRANDFLRSTIGEENYFFYMENGYLDVRGTNNSIYRITNQGKISKLKSKKIKKKLTTKIKEFIIALISIDHKEKKMKFENIEIYKGQIKDNDIPLEDSIAIVYINIMKDSDRFDIDKGCGSIYI